MLDFRPPIFNIKIKGRDLRILFRCIFGIFAPLFLILAFIPSIFLRILNVRFLNIRYLYSIGHLNCELDCYIKEQRLGIHPAYRAIFLAPIDKVVNLHILNYWRRYSQQVRFITSPILYYFLYPLTMFKHLQYDVSPYCMNDHETASCYAIYAKWAKQPPLLSIWKTDYDRGWDCLEALGIPRGAWFVCIHGREPGNRPQDKGHAHRDVDIYTYLPAVEAIVEHGGWCIRLGDNTTKPLPPMKNVIDYAHLDVKSDWMDVFLCAGCRFMLGSSSGLIFMANVFGVPCAVTNFIPTSVLPTAPADIGIFKLLWSNQKQRHLTFKEILDSPMGKANFFAPLFEKADIKIVDNSPEDVKDLAMEMIERIEGRAAYTNADENRQKRFMSLLKPGHYGYGARSRIGRDFLRTYAWLLPDFNGKSLE